MNIKMMLLVSVVISSLLFINKTLQADTQINTRIVDRLECIEDCEKQYKKLRRYARNGSPRAATLVGLIYKTGEFGRQPDADEAWRWMKQAKLQRYAPAMYYISEWYREGYRNEVDLERADDYLQRSAERGYIPAIFQLGMRKIENNENEEGMALVNVAIKAKYPLAIKFNEMLNEKFKEQITKQENDTLVLTAEVSNADEDSTDTSSNKMTEQSIKDDSMDSQNTLVVYGTKQDPQLLFVNLIKELQDIAMYNERGTTGSRLGFRKCGMPGSGCRVVKFDDGFGYDTFLRNVFGVR